MLVLLRLFFKICLLKQGPQDIPYSPLLLKILLLIYALVALLALLPIDNFFKSLFEVAVEIALISGFVWVLLVYFNKKARFTQVLCAFLGSDALISCFALPVLVSFSFGLVNEVGMILLFCLMVWHWIVCGHIIRHALSLKLEIALSVAFLYSWGFYQLMNTLFPVAGV